jgi:glycosyltransferase involved in cell wall biosynthesis
MKIPGMIRLTPNPFSRESARPRIRLLAIVEASTITGPAKNLLEFCRISRELETGPIIDASLLTFQRNGGPMSSAELQQNEFAQRALSEGIELFVIQERSAYDHRAMDDLKQTVDRLAPDIIQTHGIKSHFLVRACGLHRGRVWVAFNHGYTITTYKYALLAQLDRWSLRAASQVITVSRAFARRLSARGVPASRIVVLHNAADPRNPMREAAGNAPPSGWESRAPAKSHGEKLVLAVGRLSKEKRFPDLVAAIGYLLKLWPELAVRLVILGEGRERTRIERAARVAGLGNRVSLPGHTKDVTPYYRTADVLAISSLSEGSPNVLLEAMAAGLPVVATAVGGIPEIVTDEETALLVPPRDPASLARAIGRLLSDRSLSESIAGRARDLIRTHYSPRSRAESLVELYAKLTSAKWGAGASGSPAQTSVALEGDSSSIRA